MKKLLVLIVLLTILSLFVPFTNIAFAQDNDPPTLSINDVTVNDWAGGYAIFTVSLSSPISLTVTVDFSTADGTATAGSDYTATSDTLTFSPGETVSEISILIEEDHLYEGGNTNDETFFLNLANPTNATISDGQGIGTIQEVYPNSADLVRWEENGHYYVFYYGYPVQREQASAFCVSYGGFLVQINDADEQNFINNFRLLKGENTGLWIGLQRECPTCYWKWDNGEPFCPYVDCYWGFFGLEGSEINDELFASMETFGDITDGLWRSSGDGIEVFKPCFVAELSNPLPAADAGQDQSVIVGIPVSLDGGSSSDPDDDYPLTFSWEISAKPVGSTAVLDDPVSVTPFFTPDVPGTYDITLVVYDSYGAESNPDQVTIEAFSLELMIEDLIDKINGSTDLPEATKTSLAASLDAALKILNDSNQKNDVAAINAIEAFINKIEAQRGKKIPEEIADELISDAIIKCNDKNA